LGPAKVEEVVIEEREHVAGEVARRDGERGKALTPLPLHAADDPAISLISE